MQRHEYLRKLRTDNGYKQGHVAAEVGLSQQAYSKIECGRTKTLSPELQEGFAKFYQVPITNFEDGAHAEVSRQMPEEKENESRVVRLLVEVIMELLKDGGKK